MKNRLLTQLRDAPLKISRETGKAPVITGYGAVFYRAGDPGTEYWLWSDMVERIMPGAFDRAIREDDTRSFFNHDANFVLGRRQAGTLKLSVDSRGLLYDATPPDSQVCRDQVLAPIERGDVSGSSFMFIPRKTVWVEEKRDGGTIYIRELHDVELWEVGPVVFPAYEATTTGIRGEQKTGWPIVLPPPAMDLRGLHGPSVREEWQAWIKSRTAEHTQERDRVELQFAEMRRREAEFRLDELGI